MSKEIESDISFNLSMLYFMNYTHVAFTGFIKYFLVGDDFADHILSVPDDA